MNARSELLAYMAACLATVAGLFTLQIWYASYLDVAVVHGDNSGLPPDPKVVALRERERALLSTGKVPIDAAKKAFAARGRQANPKIAAKPSDDLSAMSGWVYRRGFKAYEPRSARLPAGATATLQGEVSAPAPPAEQAP